MLFRSVSQSRYCPWKVLGDDDPRGCSGDKPMKIGTWSPKTDKIEGDADTIKAYLINNPEYTKENNDNDS